MVAFVVVLSSFFTYYWLLFYCDYCEFHVHFCVYSFLKVAFVSATSQGLTVVCLCHMSELDVACMQKDSVDSSQDDTL